RHVYVYIPKQIKPNAPFMVVQDGHSYINRMAPVLDNMIAAHRVPAMIIIAPDSGGSDAQGSERGLEYDTLSDRYSNWVEQELLPAVAQKYGVTFTSDPEGRAAMGGSSGAICAWTMACSIPSVTTRCFPIPVPSSIRLHRKTPRLHAAVGSITPA
ncbi:MAG TPA: alpha/beta hydrolase-fold protein, partial [Rhizomicrobium sp.]|nr:alpha/beta hydrolase-fold protein [Rhizomicrobium sp.]